MAEARAAHSIGFLEFVVLAAATMSTQAIAIDAMLPAFPTIVRVLNVAAPNHGQWIVTAYMAGLGVGQLFWGMLSDRFGRRPILLGGLMLYVAAALLCSSSGTFQALLAWRFVHGLAAACVTVTRSVVRDLYAGRKMARVMSLTFVVFLTVPILAPSLGQLILIVAPWRYIFVVFAAFAATVATWGFVRLPETLHPEYRLMLTRKHVLNAAKLVLGNRASIFYTLAMMVMFGTIMAYVGMVAQIFSDVFRRPNLMPSMFALCAIFMGMAAYLNSRIVERLGMRLISHTALLMFIAVAGLHLVIAALGAEQLWTFVALQAFSMACFSMSVSNFGAMAMEPVGSVAGIAASLQGFISTFSGALVGIIIGTQFNGTTLPLAAGQVICGIASLGFVLLAEKGRLFRAHHSSNEPMITKGAQIEAARPR
ncbi:MAG TPA: multidrug effflux MFS transporter [Steroidobacteraceae bacterium]|jgi:DHA1 family bicyclomycin/chloramphenicol resistance-like MFS transporter|nr:multidrug effflux MFS transporter [Steroidobacteraceae bacterium]